MGSFAVQKKHCLSIGDMQTLHAFDAHGYGSMCYECQISESHFFSRALVRSKMSVTFTISKHGCKPWRRDSLSIGRSGMRGNEQH
jgi:hypothetical protein